MHSMTDGYSYNWNERALNAQLAFNEPFTNKEDEETAKQITINEKDKYRMRVFTNAQETWSLRSIDHELRLFECYP